jgi:hypothetical protein
VSKLLLRQAELDPLPDDELRQRVIRGKTSLFLSIVSASSGAAAPTFDR